MIKDEDLKQTIDYLEGQNQVVVYENNLNIGHIPIFVKYLVKKIEKMKNILFF